MDLELWTHAEVLERLPRWMVADFNCPDRGPHAWVCTSVGLQALWFCKHCPARRRETCPDDTRDPLEVIYALQFRR